MGECLSLSLYITFQVHRNLMALTKLQEKSFDDVMKALLDHYEPKGYLNGQIVERNCAFHGEFGGKRVGRIPILYRKPGSEI